MGGAFENKVLHCVVRQIYRKRGRATRYDHRRLGDVIFDDVDRNTMFQKRLGRDDDLIEPAR